MLHNPDWRMCGIGDHAVNVHALINLPITIGSHEYEIEALVADIFGAGVLGANFLSKYQAIQNHSSGEQYLMLGG